MASVQKHSIDSPDETRTFKAHGHVDVVTLDDFTIGRAVFEPGWRWSDDVKPIAGTMSCQTRHTGICTEGSMTVKHDNGEVVTYNPGDVFVMEPGHDAWVNGDVPCVMLDTGVAAYAKPTA